MCANKARKYVLCFVVIGRFNRADFSVNYGNYAGKNASVANVYNLSCYLHLGVGKPLMIFPKTKIGKRKARRFFIKFDSKFNLYTKQFSYALDF
jgi:hypothetical protein